MPAYATEAIILQIRTAGEADLLVDFLTPRLGQLRGVAKGAKKSRKRFVHCLEPACRVRLQIFEKTGRPWVRIEAGELIEDFISLRGDFRKWGLAGLWCELTREVVPPGDANPRIFELLRKALTWLAAHKPEEEIGCIFQLKLLKLAGFGLPWTQCPRCGKSGPDFCQAVFSPRRGTLMCPECHGGEPGVRLSLSALQSLRQAERLEPDKAFRIRLDPGPRREIETLLAHFRLQVIGRELRSAQVLRQLQEPYQEVVC